MFLTGIVILHNCSRIKYPWREAIQSLMPICTTVIAMDCDSDDGSSEELHEWAERDSTIRVEKGRWGPRAEIIAEMTNAAIEMVKDGWHINIQADEVLHESGYDEINWLVQQTMYDAGRIKYKHFVGDFNTTFPFMYDSAVRLARSGSNWRSVGDGVEYGHGDRAYRIASACMFHYGKTDVGREREAAFKEREFQRLFEHMGLGFPDPLVVEAYERGWISYRDIFHVACERGEFKPFKGTHPAAARSYIDKQLSQ